MRKYTYALLVRIMRMRQGDPTNNILPMTWHAIAKKEKSNPTQVIRWHRIGERLNVKMKLWRVAKEGK